jgi:polyisoprenoid-binding protein YceI
MKFLKIAFVLLAILVILTFAAVSAGFLRRSAPIDQRDTSSSAGEHLMFAGERYRLDSSQSKFIAHAMAGGLLWFKGHDHLVAVRDFTGEAQLTPDQINTASLQIDAKTASMIETSSVFTDPQKQIIDKELREIVLQPEQYPDIVFRSTQVSGEKGAGDSYDLKIIGNLTLHGVTKQITIPTKVTLTGNDLRAVGEFSIERGDFKVKATSAVHGLVQVRDTVKFNFDIVGHRM